MSDGAAIFFPTIRGCLSLLLTVQIILINSSRASNRTVSQNRKIRTQSDYGGSPQWKISGGERHGIEHFEMRINKSDKYTYFTHICIYVSCPAYLINILMLNHSWWIRLGGGHSTLCFEGSEFLEPVQWIHHVLFVSNCG